jgi:trimethylamine:corrinoid methyltransferase-like protein
VHGEHGQPVVITPFTLMGAMAPVTLAAALAQQNAEALFGLVLAQRVRPGTPVVYGAFTSNVDMRSGAPAFGTPENAKANVASGQLARRYRLPYRTSNASASNAADAQGAYETEMSLWGAVLGHGNLIYHAAGWQEGGLTASFEKLVLDVEMLQQMAEFLRPIVVDEHELGFEAIEAWRPAVIFSASRIRWSATSTRSISRWSRTGKTTRTGNLPVQRMRLSVQPRFTNKHWPNTSSRRWMRGSARNSTPT